MIGIGASGWGDAAAAAVVRKYTVYPLLCFVLSLPVVPRLSEKLPEKAKAVLSPVLSVALLAVSVLFLIGQSYNPFIYFRF